MPHTTLDLITDSITSCIATKDSANASLCTYAAKSLVSGDSITFWTAPNESANALFYSYAAKSLTEDNDLLALAQNNEAHKVALSSLYMPLFAPVQGDSSHSDSSKLTGYNTSEQSIDRVTEYSLAQGSEQSSAEEFEQSCAHGMELFNHSRPSVAHSKTWTAGLIDKSAVEIQVESAESLGNGVGVNSSVSDTTDALYHSSVDAYTSDVQSIYGKTSATEATSSPIHLRAELMCSASFAGGNEDVGCETGAHDVMAVATVLADLAVDAEDEAAVGHGIFSQDDSYLFSNILDLNVVPVALDSFSCPELSAYDYAGMEVVVTTGTTDSTSSVISVSELGDESKELYAFCEEEGPVSDYVSGVLNALYCADFSVLPHTCCAAGALSTTAAQIYALANEVGHKTVTASHASATDSSVLVGTTEDVAVDSVHEELSESSVVGDELFNEDERLHCSLVNESERSLCDQSNEIGESCSAMQQRGEMLLDAQPSLLLTIPLVRSIHGLALNSSHSGVTATEHSAAAKGKVLDGGACSSGSLADESAMASDAASFEKTAVDGLSHSRNVVLKGAWLQDDKSSIQEKREQLERELKALSMDSYSQSHDEDICSDVAATTSTAAVAVERGSSSGKANYECNINIGSNGESSDVYAQLAGGESEVEAAVASSGVIPCSGKDVTQELLQEMSDDRALLEPVLVPQVFRDAEYSSHRATKHQQRIAQVQNVHDPTSVRSVPYKRAIEPRHIDAAASREIHEAVQHSEDSSMPKSTYCHSFERSATSTGGDAQKNSLSEAPVDGSAGVDNSRCASQALCGFKAIGAGAKDQAQEQVMDIYSLHCRASGSGNGDSGSTVFENILTVEPKTDKADSSGSAVRVSLDECMERFGYNLTNLLISNANRLRRLADICAIGPGEQFIPERPRFYDKKTFAWAVMPIEVERRTVEDIRVSNFEIYLRKLLKETVMIFDQSATTGDVSSSTASPVVLDGDEVIAVPDQEHIEIYGELCSEPVSKSAQSNTTQTYKMNGGNEVASKTSFSCELNSENFPELGDELCPASVGYYMHKVRGTQPPLPFGGKFKSANAKRRVPKKHTLSIPILQMD